MKTYTIRIYSAGKLVFSGKCKAASFDAAYQMASLSAQAGDTIKIS
jgi:hypothetical protein